jgi:hypothetical protein
VLFFSTLGWPAITLVLIFVVLYLLTFRSIPSGAYALDPNDAGTGGDKGRGTFEPHNRNYLELAKLVIGLGSASVGALTVLFLRNDSSAGGLRRQVMWPLAFFVGSVVYGVAFIGCWFGAMSAIVIGPQATPVCAVP